MSERICTHSLIQGHLWVKILKSSQTFVIILQTLPFIWTHASRIPLISHYEKKLCCCKGDQKCLLHFHTDIHIFLVLVAVVLHGRDQNKFPLIEILVY
jgi:hypothetical protein